MNKTIVFIVTGVLFYVISPVIINGIKYTIKLIFGM